MTPTSVVTADLRQADLVTQITGALDSLLAGPGRTLRIVGEGGQEESLVELLMPERPLRRDLVDYSRNIFLVSLGIAAVTAFTLYMLASRLLIDPVLRLRANMLAFRQGPENATLVLEPSRRRDEIGTVERELAAMEKDLASMLRSRRHLADLGLAVAKINHDLRNTLAAAQLLSDQVATLDDPKVQRLAPRLVTTLDRAIGFVQAVLDYGRETTTQPQFAPTNLRGLVEDAAFEARLAGHPDISLVNDVDGSLVLSIDAGQVARALVNLLKNAREALEADPRQDHPRVVVVSSERDEEGVRLAVSDNGPGLPPRARDNLFVAFEGSARAGGTGLGLAIAREILEAHGGTVRLAEQPEGTRFELVFPTGLVEDKAVS